HKKWRAFIHLPKSIRGNQASPKHVGYYFTELDAARAYNDAAIDLLGDKAELNILPIEEAIDPDPPTPEEIAAQCRAIRAGWSEQEHRRRAPHWSRRNSVVRYLSGKEVNQ